MIRENLVVSVDEYGHLGWEQDPDDEMAEAYVVPMDQIREWFARHNTMVNQLRALGISN